MDQDRTSIDETPKLGTGAFDGLAPGDRLETAFSGARDATGFLEGGAAARDGGGETRRKDSGPSEGRIVCNVDARATPYGHTYALLVPQAVIPEHEREDVIEVRIARASRSKKEYTLYCKHAPGYPRAYLDLFSLPAKRGEKFRILSVRKCHPSEFASAYNRKKPKGMENTEMVFDGHSFKIMVDDAHGLAVIGWRLDTYQGRIVLHGTLLGTRANAVTVSVGSFESTVKLPRRQPIVSMTAHGDDFVVGYRHWASDSRVRLRLITTGKPDEQVHHPLAHQISFQPDEMELDAGVGVDQLESVVRVTFTEEARYRAWKYWASAQSHNERKGHQGDIGEAVVCAVLEKSGYRVVERHTVKSERFRPRHQCRALGRDILAVKEGQYYVAEVKHWKEYKELALKAAETELLKFADGPERDELEERLQAKIKGAIASQLDWSYRSAEAVLHWRYVELNAGKQRHRLRCLKPPLSVRASRLS